MKKIKTPLTVDDIISLKVGDMVSLSGRIFAGRDAVLPKVVKILTQKTPEQCGIYLEGSVIFHTAVSPAGLGPTSSNKAEIESTIPELSRLGVRLHLGKGALSPKTIAALNRFGSVYAVVPPVTALLVSKTLTGRVVAFPEEGMEALHELDVVDYPIIIAAAHGSSIYDK